MKNEDRLNTDMEVGDILKSMRLGFGYTLADIEYALNIRENQVDAIERGDISKLPGKVYAVGFVRSYAEYLDLDVDTIVDMFKEQYLGGQPKSDLSFPEIILDKKSPAISVVVLAILLYFIFVFAWHQFNNYKFSNSMKIDAVSQDIKSHLYNDILIDSKPKADDLIANKAADQNPTNNLNVENMAKDIVQKSGVILNIMDSSWVEIKNSRGEILISNILEKGDQYFVPDSPGLSMSLGNAANVEILINGRALMPLGKDGDVRRDIPLDISYLKTLEFKDIEDNKIKKIIEEIEEDNPKENTKINPPSN